MEVTTRATSRRTLLRSAAVIGGALATHALAPLGRALAGAPAILKPLPADQFVDFGTNAEMRWESVDPRRYLTPQSRLFVRNHTATPTIDATTYSLALYGDGLRHPRAADAPLRLSLRDLKRLPRTTIVTTHECTGNGRSFFATQQGTPASGTAWRLGAVGAVAWEGVRLRDVLRHVGLDPAAMSVQATGLDADYVTGGVDYGAIRRPFPIGKALDDALLAWGANGEPLLPDHGYPLRLVLPGWVGVASIKWLGSLEVSTTELTSPWNTKWYTIDGVPLAENPVRSAWELPWGAQLERRRRIELTGRSWSGAGPIERVEVSVDGGDTWAPARVRRGRDRGWSQWSWTWSRPEAGSYELLARATDRSGRTQPALTPFNPNGYFFDAVVKHPVTVV
ncbi:molybdopterin-dependent oxidoreductase [Nocardioides sp. MAH-18]|uniref:Molybdopterin-dependent oxidoreductase n=1 Tax=Nocardioides agri TaxID=2682843 RepID=A0A6L6XNB8_9ACTN|nr:MULTISPECIES: sulfite oxidase [unclassified Nocardioides]MBA2953355.1 sulfite oxidase [Nocardioides sp. CGMCC 1.13656]MVQ48223.1 molybdopterin-dependent oxidoreductase [Nocardioides sp. MAH-18]